MRSLTGRLNAVKRVHEWAGGDGAGDAVTAAGTVLYTRPVLKSKGTYFGIAIIVFGHGQ